MQEINEVALRYDNVISNGTNKGGAFTSYIASAPKSTDIKLSNLKPGMKYELVLGFDFELDYTDHGNCAGFIAGGVH